MKYLPGGASESTKVNLHSPQEAFFPTELPKQYGVQYIQYMQVYAIV